MDNKFDKEQTPFALQNNTEELVSLKKERNEQPEKKDVLIVPPKKLLEKVEEEKTFSPTEKEFEFEINSGSQDMRMPLNAKEEYFQSHTKKETQWNYQNSKMKDFSEARPLGSDSSEISSGINEMEINTQLFAFQNTKGKSGRNASFLSAKMDSVSDASKRVDVGKEADSFTFNPFTQKQSGLQDVEEYADKKSENSSQLFAFQNMEEQVSSVVKNNSSNNSKELGVSSGLSSNVSPPVRKMIIDKVKEVVQRSLNSFQNMSNNLDDETIDSNGKKEGNVKKLLLMVASIFMVFSQTFIQIIVTIITSMFIPLLTILFSFVLVFIIIISSYVTQESRTIVDVALDEYEVSEKNIGGEKYKEWYGLDADWCCMFVSYCANECDYIEDGIFKKTASVSDLRDFFEEEEVWVDAEDYIPVPGDIIFFQEDGDSHVGIVVEVDEENNKLQTVEGNTGLSETEPYHKGSKVDKVAYLIDSDRITGYGCPNYPETESETETEEPSEVEDE